MDNLEIGDYVFATKYSDGDPCDGWAVGFYYGILPKMSENRFLVVDEYGEQFRGNGFRKIMKITPRLGERMLYWGSKFDYPPWPPAGTINLWDILKSEMNRDEPTKPD